jgi:hypothetical protein
MQPSFCRQEFKGLTTEDRDPIPATRSKELVSFLCLMQLCLFRNYSFRTISSQKGKYFLKTQVENPGTKSFITEHN